MFYHNYFVDNFFTFVYYAYQKSRCHSGNGGNGKIFTLL